MFPKTSNEMESSRDHLLFIKFYLIYSFCLPLCLQDISWGLKLESTGREEIACGVRWWDCGNIYNPGVNEKTSNHAQHSLSLITLSEDYGCYVKKNVVFLWRNFHYKFSLYHAFENTDEKCSYTIQVHVLIPHLSFVHILLLHDDNPLNL